LPALAMLSVGASSILATGEMTENDDDDAA
jgi:hypothetical protein